MTFSIAGRCSRSGMFGAAIVSSSPAVAARCVFARAGVGSGCSQNITDPRLGPHMLDLLAQGHTARVALDTVVAEAPNIAYRQLSLIDAAGSGVAYSGANTLGLHSTKVGMDCVAAGNLLATDRVPEVMVAAFEADGEDHIGDRLISALKAGLTVGGEVGPVHSSGLILVRDLPWHAADLRVDWADADPVSELAALWELYSPQLDEYIQRALDPSTAPRYGVAGDQ